MLGNARIGSMVMGLSVGRVSMRVMHMSFGDAVDFRRAGAALAGLAIPAAGEVVGLRRLDFVDDVEHDHALGNLRGVIHELAAAASPRQILKVTGFISSPR
jgi:hypothetical protein